MADEKVPSFLALTRAMEDELIAILKAQEAISMCARRDDISPEIRKGLRGLHSCMRHITEIITIVYEVFAYHIDCKSVGLENENTGNGSISLCALLNAERYPHSRVRFAFPLKHYPLGWGIATLDEVLETYVGFCCGPCRVNFLDGKDSKLTCPIRGGNPHLYHSLSAYQPLERLWTPSHRAEAERDQSAIEALESLSSKRLRKIIERER